MGNWKTKVNRKKTKQSQTPGKAKRQDTCQATKQDKYMARRSRSYKHSEYEVWCQKYSKINHGS